MAIPRKLFDPLSKTSHSSYGQILKSSALIGGSSVINILLGIIRTKFLAVLLGPSGVGLMGLYNSITTTVGLATSMGINTTGIRQIAEAAATNDQTRIARAVTVLRRSAFFRGTLGALIVLLFAVPICQFSFGNREHASGLAMLAITVLLGSILGGQSALLQGMRRIGDIAKVGMWGALNGTLLSIPLVYFFGQNGIVPFLLAVSVTSLVSSWWYARKIQVPPVKMGWWETLTEARSMLKLGAAVMAGAVMTNLVTYAARVLIVRHLDLDAAGQYQAAWTLSGLYAGFVMQAMGTDFYPRLTATGADNQASNRLINEQVEVGLLMAAPGILATLAFAPLAIKIFYSSGFGPAGEILRWQVLGILLRVATWPLGYVLLARAKSKWFFWTELAANLAHLLFLFVGLKLWGLVGTGIAFLGLSLFHAIQINVIVRRMTDFRWGAANLKLAIIILPLAIGVSVAAWYLPPLWMAVVGGAVAIFMGLYSLSHLAAALRYGTVLEMVNTLTKRVLAKIKPPAPKESL